MEPKPKNTFRDEVEKGKVSEQEMLERDQKISYLRIKSQRAILEADYRHIQSQIERVKAFGNEIFRFPNSKSRTSMLEQNKEQIEQLEKQAETFAPSRAQFVLLSIFEEKFGEDVVDNKPTTIIDSGEVNDNSDETEVAPELQDND